MTYGLMSAILFIYIGCGREHLFKVFVALMKFVQEKVHYLWYYYSDQFWVQTTKALQLFTRINTSKLGKHHPTELKKYTLSVLKEL